MKNKISLLVISNALLSVCLFGCDDNQSRYACTSKAVNFIYIQNRVENKIPSTVSFFSHRPGVVYIPISEYQNFVPSYMMSVKRDGKIYTFTNLINESKATLDASTGNLCYNSFSKFSSPNLIPHDEIGTNSIKCKKIENESSYVEGKRFIINLSSYNLEPLKDGNEYYLPIDVLMHIDPLSERGTAYYDGDKNVALLHSTNFDDYIKYGYTLLKSHPKEFYEFTYDLFTFDIDLRYGLNGYSRPMRHNNNEQFVYNKNGARSTFEKYRKDIINAQSTKDYDVAFDKMFEEIDDGGHTVVDRESFATNKEELPETFRNHKEDLYVSEIFNAEKKARKTKSYFHVEKYDADKDGHNDIGYFYITEFDDSSPYVPDRIQTILNEANKSFNKKENPGESNYIKDVVIDLANNGGGSTSAEGILLSWICGGKAKEIIKDARDNSITTSTYQYDINGDNEFNEKDYLPDDVNIYILTDATFSAACALTFDTYMYTLSDAYKTSKKNIKFIGRPNLGGACSITPIIMLPTGFSFHMSSNSVGINWNDHSITCDQIMPISEGWDMTVNQIVDREGYINPKIVEARK